MIDTKEFFKHGFDEFEVNNKGEVVFYKEHKFNDYFWECECPTLGG